MRLIAYLIVYLIVCLFLCLPVFLAVAHIYVYAHLHVHVFCCFSHTLQMAKVFYLSQQGLQLVLACRSLPRSRLACLPHLADLAQTLPQARQRPRGQWAARE